MPRTIAHVMTTEAVTAHPAMPLREMAGLLAARGLNALPVVDATGRLVGIVTVADLLAGEGYPYRGTARWLWVHLERDGSGHGALTAADLMSHPVTTARAEEAVAEVARRVLRAGPRTLPVVDGDGLLVGVVSRSDLRRAVRRPDAVVEWAVRHGVFGSRQCPPVAGLSVTVEDGTVTVWGEVERPADAALVRSLLHEVEGVVAVDDQLTWRAAGDRARGLRAGRRLRRGPHLEEGRLPGRAGAGPR